MDSALDNAEVRDRRWKNTSFVVRRRVPEPTAEADGSLDEQSGRLIPDGEVVPDRTMDTSVASTPSGVELNAATAVASSAAEGQLRAAHHEGHSEMEHGAPGEPISVLSPVKTEGPGQ